MLDAAALAASARTVGITQWLDDHKRVPACEAGCLSKKSNGEALVKGRDGRRGPPAAERSKAGRGAPASGQDYVFTGAPGGLLNVNALRDRVGIQRREALQRACPVHPESHALPRQGAAESDDGADGRFRLDLAGRCLTDQWCRRGDSFGPPFGTPSHALNFRGFFSMYQALPWFRWLTLSDMDRACLRLVVLPIYSRLNRSESGLGFSDPPPCPSSGG